MDTSTVEEEPSLAQRLASLQIKLHKASQHTSELPPPLSSHDPNASFHLGLQLFGQPPQVVEKALQAKVKEVEDELQDVLETLASSGDRTTDTGLEDAAPYTPEDLEQEAMLLQAKIAFLTECSQARQLLDECKSLCNDALAARGVGPTAAAVSGDEPGAVRAGRQWQAAQPHLQQADRMAQQQVNEALQKYARDRVAAIKFDSRLLLVQQRKLALETWAAAVVVERDHVKVTASPKLGMAYDVLSVLFQEQDGSVIHDMLRQFTLQLHKALLEPLLQPAAHKEGGSLPITDWTMEVSEEVGSALSSGDPASKRTFHYLSWKKPLGTARWGIAASKTEPSTAEALAAWKEVIGHVQSVVRFIAEHVLLYRSELCAMVGDHLFGIPLELAPHLDSVGAPRLRIQDDDPGLLMEPLVNGILQSCVPDYLAPDNLHQLRDMSVELNSFVGPFLQQLKSLNFLEDPSASRMAEIASTWEYQYITRRKAIILEEARQLILTNDYHNTVKVGEDAHPKLEIERLGLPDGQAIFKLDYCNISDTAFKIESLCRRALDEAVALPPFDVKAELKTLPVNLFHTARTVLDMFRMLVVHLHGEEAQKVPRTAAILHNDCAYFAHQCLSLGLQYRDKFPEPAAEDDVHGLFLRQHCMFVDMVPLFRERAEQSMQHMLQLQVDQIMDLMADRIHLLGQALREDNPVAEWSDAEAAVDAAVYHTRHLVQVWKPVLDYEVFHRAIGHLVDTIFAQLLAQLDRAKAISALACDFASEMFGKAVEQLDKLLDQDHRFCALWGRFAALAKFLTMRLTEVEVGLSSGIFRDVTAAELQRLIQVCFDDSPKRSELLTLLAQHNE